MSLTIGMTAAPRSVSYLDRSLASLFQAGADQVYLFAEPGTRRSTMYRHQVRIVQRDAKLGNWNNWRDMAERLSQIETDWILTCEDDVEFSNEALKLALDFTSVRQDPLGVLSLYTSPKYDLPMGFVEFSPRVLLGACAWLWPSRSLRTVLDHPLTSAWTGNVISNKPTPPSEMDGVDTLVGRVLRDLGLPIIFAVPSLIEHIGDVSTFPGKSWSKIS